MKRLQWNTIYHGLQYTTIHNGIQYTIYNELQYTMEYNIVNIVLSSFFTLYNDYTYKWYCTMISEGISIVQ